MDIKRKEEVFGNMSDEHSAWPAWWRAKIGNITPSVDLTTCPELQAVFPKGVLLLHTRVMLREVTPEALRKLADEVLYAAELLGTAKPDVISYSCTSSAIMKGADYEADIVQRIADATGAKGTSMVRSVIEALHFLEVRKLVIVAPYLQEIVDAEEKYLESFGFETVHSVTFSSTDPIANAARAPWENYQFALDAARQAHDADAVFISCGALRTIEIIEHLERATDMPVVSSNLCTAWNCLRLAGIKQHKFASADSVAINSEVRDRRSINIGGECGVRDRIA